MIQLLYPNRIIVLWKDVMIAQIAPAQINAPVVFLGDAAKYELDRIKVKGKAVAVQVMFGCLHGDTSDK